MFFIVSISTKEVHAIDNNIEWDIKINQIGEARRWYFNSEFTFLTQNMQKPSVLVDVYNINTKEVAIQAELINQITHIYVSVDDRYIGYADENLIDYSGDKSRNFTTFVVKNLTPGQHKIEVKADTQDYMSTAQKKDIIYVNMLAYEDEEIVKSIEDIKNGIANLYDYEIVGVDVVNSNNIQAVNDEIKGKNLDAYNVQTSIIQIVNQINAQIKLQDAFGRINLGTGTLSDYTTIGVINVTSSNLSGVNAAVKNERDAKGTNLGKDEIQNIVEDLPNRINDANTRINGGIATLADYLLIGITGVTDINLADVNTYVKGKDNSTKSKLQTNVNTIVNALSAINQGNTSITYYTTLGITTVTADNVTAISKNIVSARTAKGNNLTKAEIQKVVDDSLITSLAQNLVIAKQAVTATNNVEEIQQAQVTDEKTKAVLKEKNKIDEALEKINAGEGTVKDYKLIEIIGVTDTNLEYINKKIKEAKDDKGSNLTKSEINELVQALINNTTSVKENVSPIEIDEYEIELIKNDSNNQDISSSESKIEILSQQKTNSEGSINSIKLSEETIKIEENRENEEKIYEEVQVINMILNISIINYLYNAKFLKCQAILLASGTSLICF